MPWPLFLSLRQLFPPRRFPVFATVSILGVALGVTALLLVQTVMNSFGEEHRQRIRDAVGDVVVTPVTREVIPDTPTLTKTLATSPGVAAAAAYIEGPVLYIAPGGDLAKSFSPRNILLLRGLDPAREPAVSPLPGFVEEGTFADLEDGTVIVGRSLARRLGLYVGAKMTLQSPARAARSLEKHAGGDEFHELPKELDVCGLLHTGFNDVDANAVIVTLRTARELQKLAPGESTGIRLKLTDREAAGPVSIAVNKRLGDDLEARPWYTFRQEFLQAVAMEKQMLFLLMFIITLVASFSIGSTLFSHVVRRNREIGLLGALGAKPRDVLTLYLAQGFIIGLAGFVLGVAMTFLILAFRQEVVGLCGAQDILLKQYRFDSVPLHYNPADFVKAGALTLGLMTGAAFVPALWASRRKPSEAMRDV